MSDKHTARESLEGIVRIERDLVEFYRRVAEHEKHADVGARLSLLEARHLSAASRSERLLDEIRHHDGGGFVSEVAAKLGDALVQLIAGVPVEIIQETHEPSISTLKRFEKRLHECYVKLSEVIAEPFRSEALRGVNETDVNLEELQKLDAYA